MNHYLILNYKTYPEATAENAEKLTAIVQDLRSTRTDPELTIIVCPQASDIFRIREEYPEIELWAQHIDAIDPGRNTGWISPETLVEEGATGTLVNHSEHPGKIVEIKKTIETAKKYQLTTCLCTPDIITATQILPENPDIVAFEPPELISTPESILDVDQMEARKFIQQFKNVNIPLLLGAGIRDAQDVTGALELGFQGVLLSSGFVKATDPREFLEEIIEAFHIG